MLCLLFRSKIFILHKLFTSPKPALNYLHGKSFSQKREIPFMAENVSIWTHCSSELDRQPVQGAQHLVDKGMIKKCNKS